MAYKSEVKDHGDLLLLLWSGIDPKDIWPVRYFLEQGFNLFVCQSFAKNLGMYGERVGALHIVVSNKDIAARLSSQLK